MQKVNWEQKYHNLLGAILKTLENEVWDISEEYAKISNKGLITLGFLAKDLSLTSKFSEGVKFCAVCGGLRSPEELTVCNKCGETISRR